MRARNYRPLSRSSIVGRLLLAAGRTLVTEGFLSKDHQGRDREEFIEDAFEMVFGSSPVMDVRKDMLALPTGVAFGVGGVTCLLSAFVGILVGWLGPNRAGAGIVLLGLLLASPFLGMTFVWAYRWFMNDRDYAAWVRAGRPAGWIPRASSQPSDRDFLLGTPWIALFAWFAIGSWLTL